MKLKFAAVLALGFVCSVVGFVGCSSGSGSTLAPATVTPTVISVTPSNVIVGSPALTLTVNGTGFQSTTTLQVGGVAVTAVYVSSSKLTATVPANSLAKTGTLQVVASNGSSSSTALVNLEVDNPVPAITGFAPLSLVAGAGAQSLSVTGTGFLPSTVIQVSGSARTTTYVSATQMTVALTAADIASAGSLALTAVNPAPGGGNSAGASIPVTNPMPGLLSIAPSTVVAGLKTSTTITVTGTNFVSTSVAQFNGSARATTVLNTTQLTFQITPDDVVNAGTASITVTNPAPGGGTSPAVSLTIATPTPTPTITSVSPTQLIVNSPGSLTVQGTNLNTSSIVLWNGSALKTSFASYTISGNTYSYLIATVPSALLTSTGTATITVSNPTAISASNAVTINIANPPVPTVKQVSPGGAPLNTATAITVTGTSFTSGSTIQIDGVTLSTNFVSGTSLTAQIPASMLTVPANRAITVTTPAPGGGVSSPAAFTAYIGIPTNAMALNPVNGLLYVSVPSAAGAPYGNSVVSVDPATGALGTPVYVGSEPNKLAISSDGATLWVGLDAASAIRKVDLVTGTAGMQFSLGDNAGVYAYPPIVHAIAVLPGAPNSIVVSAMNNYYLYDDALAIYDNGVVRPNKITLSTIGTIPAIFVNPNPAKPEVYATSYESGYQVLSYDANGLTHPAGNSGDSVFNGPYGTAVQIDNGQAYLDSGIVLNAETGTQQGTFYSSGTTVATGPMVSDSALGKNFILLGTSTSYGSTTPFSLSVEAFQESDYTPIPSSIILVGGALTGTKYGAGNSSNTTINGSNPIDTLVRWGSNGLAFRAANGIFSFRSNLVKDLSSTSSDLGVAVTAPAAATTGTNFAITSTVTNGGPSAATSVVLTETVPTNAAVVSVTSSQGNCTASSVVTCSIGGLTNAASATVAIVLKPISSGAATVMATVSAGENDPTTANNTGSGTTTVSGDTYALTPTVTALSPNLAQTGSYDVTLTVSGSGFISGSTVYWGSTPLSTSYVSARQLTANVPSSALTSIGWFPVTVNTPAPGGGTSNVLAFSIYGMVALAANHLIYDPYTRLLYASVNSGATETTGNSIVSIDPATGAFGTPAAAGSQPGKMALTDDGKFLYVNETGANAVGRFNMATQALDFSFPVSAGGSFSSSTPSLRDIAAAPGTDNTVVVDLGSWPGNAVYDVDPVAKTGTTRSGTYGQNTSGPYTGSSLQFLDPTTLFSFDIDTTGSTFNRWTLSPTGLTGGYNSEYTLNSFSAFKIRGGLAYANAGGVVNPTVTPPAPTGVFLNPSTSTTNSYSYYATYGQITEPDPSLGRSFFAIMGSSTTSTSSLTLRAFDQKTFMPLEALNIPLSNSKSTSVTLIDLVRCGQDGLVLLRSDGKINLLHGAFVVPQLLGQNTAATLTGVSSSTLAHGSGNTLLTLTGSGFLPGVAVMWNGNYRTTTMVDATHVTVAIPATDLTNAGSASVTAVNPGAVASGAMVVTIN
jgi:sugar lactone lactonase YvrE